MTSCNGDIVFGIVVTIVLMPLVYILGKLALDMFLHYFIFDAISEKYVTQSWHDMLDNKVNSLRERIRELEAKNGKQKNRNL